MRGSIERLEARQKSMITLPSATPLEVCEASVFYGANRVLDRVSLSAAGGEFIALLGASGCGKTTLLRAICGFVPLASGSIAVGRRDITKLPPDKRNIAMVFQSYALWPHMTVAQNIGYGLKLRGVGRTEIAERTAALLAMLRLDGLGERKVTALSGGQRQRVALGRALAIDPQVLLLDEPLSNLDARIREDVRHEIKTLQQRLGITTVHVTHDRQEAMVMADRIVILDGGRVAQIGMPEEIYNRPNSPFVASFMGAGNIVPLRLRDAGRQVTIGDGSFSDASRSTARCWTRAGSRVRTTKPRSMLISAARTRGCVRRMGLPRAAWSCAARSSNAPIPAGSTAMPCASGRIIIWSTMRAGSRSARRSASPCRQRLCISIRRRRTRSRNTHNGQGGTL